MARRKGQLLLRQRLQFALVRLHGRLKAAGEHGAVGVHARHLEHDRHRLHEMILLAPQREGHARARRHVAVAGRVDHDFRHDRLAARFALQNHAAHRAVLGDCAADERVEPQPHARLLQHIQLDLLQLLRIDGHAGRFFVREAPLFHHAAEQLLIEFAPDRAGKVAHHARRGNAAHRAQRLDQHHARSLTRRAHRRRKARGAGAGHQHVHRVDHRNLPGGFLIIGHFHHPLRYACHALIIPCGPRAFL